MKAVLCAGLAFAASISAIRANELAASPGAESARFAAVSLTNGQGLRAIVSNVLVPANGTQLATCPVQVSFIAADGSLIGNVTAVQLKAGESTSVSVSHPSRLVRAVISIDDVLEPAKVCALRTSVEIFDQQTGITFVSVSGASISGNTECSLSAAPTSGAPRKNVAVRANSTTLATSASGGPATPKTRSPALADPLPPIPR